MPTNPIDKYIIDLINRMTKQREERIKELKVKAFDTIAASDDWFVRINYNTAQAVCQVCGRETNIREHSVQHEDDCVLLEIDKLEKAF